MFILSQFSAIFSVLLSLFRDGDFQKVSNTRAALAKPSDAFPAAGTASTPCRVDCHINHGHRVLFGFAQEVLSAERAPIPSGPLDALFPHECLVFRDLSLVEPLGAESVSSRAFTSRRPLWRRGGLVTRTGLRSQRFTRVATIKTTASVGLIGSRWETTSVAAAGCVAKTRA
ncbi:hypothetical protein MRX96_033415 [Rhipicephalus microplus]